MLDSTDLDLLALLREDGRASWTSLGTAVGLSPDAARVRVERLIADGVGRPTTLIDPTVFGYTTRIVLGVTTLGAPAAFLDWAAQQDGVIHLVRVVGRFTFLAEVVAGSVQEAHDFVNITLGSVEGVIATEMMIITSIVRWRADTRPNWVLDSTPIDLNPQDVDIMRVLVDEPRIGLAEMADRLERPYAPLRRRVLALYSSGIIRTTAVVDDAAASGSTSALLLVRRRGDIDRVREAIMARPEVTILVTTTGRFAFAGEIVGADLHGLETAASAIAASGAEVEYMPYARVEKLPGSLSFEHAAASRRQ